ncbi:MULTISPECIES: lysophospholipid acyltransferase family protein [Acidobacterium]|uniref:lysophospholipid acyltransferase family protein n=1 Tax=Acidobacterium TaxID=33973 RepID=UPI000311419C|nr:MULTISPECIES: lysophospholipid acyltransferase family protein [Acidobacterium]HCT62220.1 1-acyl-sn-glycerol-3-phosphate acyltransferase [Acidobacterium sp.]
MSTQTLAPRPEKLSLGERIANVALRAPAILGATAFFGSLSLLASLVEKDGKWQHRIAQRWARACVAASGGRLTVLHGERLKPQVAVYACNHLSYMDTPVIFSTLPFQFRIVARHDLWKLPFIGWHLERSGQVPVNVDNPRASIASLSSAVRTLKSGMPLFIFPEGGRTRDGHLAPFLNGPAFMAIRAQVPIVPMALIGTHELLPIHAGQLHAVPVTLVVGEPIETSGYSMKQVNELTARLYAAIADLYYGHTYLPRPAVESPVLQEATESHN